MEYLHDCIVLKHGLQMVHHSSVCLQYVKHTARTNYADLHHMVSVMRVQHSSPLHFRYEVLNHISRLKQ